MKPNFAGMVSGWFPFKIVFERPTLHSEWLQNISIRTLVNFIEDAQKQYHAYISATIKAISMPSDFKIYAQCRHWDIRPSSDLFNAMFWISNIHSCMAQQLFC